MGKKKCKEERNRNDDELQEYYRAMSFMLDNLSLVQCHILSVRGPLYDNFPDVYFWSQTTRDFCFPSLLNLLCSFSPGKIQQTH